MKKIIAIQGFEGCFHQIAAENYFGKTISTLPCDSFTKVVDSVTSGAADAGLMAIENSTAGSILSNYDLLQQSDLHITGEIYLHIRQHLITLPDTKLEEISEVRSHPMALLQCRPFLKTRQWHLRETEDTALSAKQLRDENLVNTAAIASDLAANLYGLKIIQEDIHSEKNNYTRFLVLNKTPKTKDMEHDHKASLYFQVDNNPGQLGKVLAEISSRGINLSKLQSFPIQHLEWQYYFHCDLEFSEMNQLDSTLTAIQPLTQKLRVLGVYEKGMTI